MVIFKFRSTGEKIMSSDLPQQTTPVIIKGGSKKASIPIRINAYSTFQVTESFQSESDDWIQSESDFTVSYIESFEVGEPGGNLQFCQTAFMLHPLTFAFKDSNNTTILTITEVADGAAYDLHIAVQYSGGFFQIEQTSELAEGTDWSESVFEPADAEIYLVEVTDRNNLPVCQIIRATDESDIFLNLEPPV
jgi:hypothetical protein